MTVHVGDAEVLPSTAVRDIGAMLDPTLTMAAYINSISKSCYSQIRALSKIRKYLSEDAAKSLAHAFVTSRLDNMNSLLYNMSLITKFKNFNLSKTIQPELS